MDTQSPVKGFFENDSNLKIVCLNITRTYQGKEREDLMDCARKYWRIRPERAEKADYVFAISAGVIVGVFKPHKWFRTDSKEWPGRYEFEGDEVKDSPYLHMKISHLLGRRQNPVAYINM